MIFPNEQLRNRLQLVEGRIFKATGHSSIGHSGGGNGLDDRETGS
jgi:hypothetical protein